MSDQDYLDGWEDGKAGRDPNSERLNYGANRCNDYEIGYIDSGLGDVPQRSVDRVGLPQTEEKQ